MNTSTEENLENLYNEMLRHTDKMCATNNPMAVAGVMVAQALSIYKTAMSADDYDLMVTAIYNNRDNVKTFEGPLLQ
jgi:hypothetical protein